MRNKFLTLVIEAVVANLFALFLINKFANNSSVLFALLFVLIMILISLQGYYQIVIPYGKKLMEAEKSAEDSKNAEIIRSEFVANVSHELKTPLTSISGFIETLQAGAAEDPEIRTKFIDIIAIETSRLKRMIEDLLVLSDIENRREFDNKEFDIKEVIENTIYALKPIAEDKKIALIQDIEEGCRVTGSADRFSQMMVNLIENAVKYSDVGKRVWIDVHKSDSSITVSVRDEGIGIAPEHHERLFERFYRVDKSRSQKAGGTGLGLSIVKHIAALLGAKLNVESQVGEGTTFYVVFEDIA